MDKSHVCLPLALKGAVQHFGSIFLILFLYENEMRISYVS